MLKDGTLVKIDTPKYIEHNTTKSNEQCEEKDPIKKELQDLIIKSQAVNYNDRLAIKLKIINLLEIYNLKADEMKNLTNEQLILSHDDTLKFCTYLDEQMTLIELEIDAMIKGNQLQELTNSSNGHQKTFKKAKTK